MVSDDLFAILHFTGAGAADTLGYVHQVGPVYVSLLGADFNHAVEIGQSLAWDRAVGAFDNS
jgi:hypothetical protein